MYRHPVRLRPLVAILGLSTLGLPAVWFANTANAGGFALIEHGASGMGVAYAGAAAVSNDTSTVWFNPAGMSEIEGREIAAALHVLNTDSPWTDQSTRLGSVFGSAEVSGADTANPGTTGVLPNLYYVSPINDQWSYGLSIGVPFGSSTEYDNDWKGRYTTVESGINVLDINPALSYQISDQWRLGFGISLQQLTAELGNNVDSGAACLGFSTLTQGATVSAADCVNAGLTPGNFDNDTTAEINGDSTAFGFNLGALYIPSENVKIGIAYRHSVEHELDGDAEFNVNPALRTLLDGDPAVAITPELAPGLAQALAGGRNLLINRSATAEVQLPATFSLSGAWQVNDKFQLLSDLTWTGWGTFEELRIVFDEPQFQGDSLNDFSWEDALRFSAGVNYNHTPKLTLRAGYAFDETPIPSAQRRTARIPGNDRTWVTFGLGYAVTQQFSFDLGYAFITLDDTPIDNANEENTSGPGVGTFVRGLYDDPNVGIFSAQLNWDFN